VPTYTACNQASTSGAQKGVRRIVCFRLFKTKSHTAIKFMRFRGIALLLAGIKKGRGGRKLRLTCSLCALFHLKSFRVFKL
jgi:hypothetical protein